MHEIDARSRGVQGDAGGEPEDFEDKCLLGDVRPSRVDVNINIMHASTWGRLGLRLRCVRSGIGAVPDAPRFAFHLGSLKAKAERQGDRQDRIRRRELRAGNKEQGSREPG